MQKHQVSGTAYLRLLAAFTMLTVAFLTIASFVRLASGESRYFSGTMTLAGFVTLIFLSLFYKKFLLSPPPQPFEPVQERSDTQVALDAANAEFDDFERAFMLSSDDPFRGMVHDSWKELYKLLTSGGSAGEVRAARMNLAYYWKRWKENAPIQVEKGWNLYQEKHGVGEVSSPPEQNSVQG